jgi:iron complex outermembrane recepter protein
MLHRRGRTNSVPFLLATLISLLVFGTTSATEAPRRHFSIAAGDAAQALRDFALQSDLQLLFNYSEAAGLNTVGVTGDYEVTEALEILLRGTGLQFGMVDERTIAIFSSAPSLESAVVDLDGRALVAQATRSDATVGSSQGQAVSPAAPAGEPAGRVLEEIVVTAQRRAEVLQKVPLAITAFGTEEIRQSRMYGLNDIAIRTPGFNLGDFSPESPNLTLRGIGSTDRDAGSDRSVVVFVDETYIGRAGASTFDLFDLERVEVLHGPQGTLYGKNVVGGAVNIITRKPERETDAYIETGLGNYSLIETRGMFNAPLNDKLATRFAISTRDRDGFQTNAVTGNDVDTADNASARAHLRFEPNSDTDLLLTAEYARDRIFGVSRKVSPAGPFTTSLGFVPDPNPRTVELNDDGKFDRDAYSLIGRLDRTTGFGELTILSAYRDVSSHVIQDVVAIPLESSFDDQGRPRGFLSIDDTTEDYRIFSQEVRVASPIGDSPHSWVVGAYYSDERTERVSVRERSLLAVTSLPKFDQGNDTRNYAIFGQATYALTPRLNLTLGGRYTRDSKDFRLAVSDESGGTADTLNPATEEFDITADDSWTAFTSRLALDFALTDDVMLYASASRGFKGGGFQGFAPDAASAQISFDPEYAWNYETGLRSQWLDRRLIFNVTAFFVDYTDLQFRQRVLTVPGDEASAVVIILNASDAEILGIESAVSVRPLDNLELSASYAYLDTEITSFRQDIPDPPDIVGNRLALAPKNSYVLSAKYGIPLQGGAWVNLRADYKYKGQHYFEVEQWEAGNEGGYGLLDGRVSFFSPDESWEVALWGRNLTDKVYRSQVQSGVNGTIGISRFGDPRTYGVSFIWRYR